MQLSKIIKETEEFIQVKEIKSKVLLPTCKFVASPDFAFGAIVIAILMLVILLPNAFAYTQQEIDRNGIKDVKVRDLTNNTSTITFDYCYNKYSKDSVGVLVTSDLDVVPVPINPNTEYRQCDTYGTKILAESNSIITTLFKADDIDKLISIFNAKTHDLKNDYAQTNQQLVEQKKLDPSQNYDDLVKKIELLEKQIKSAQSGLKTLITMKKS